MGQRNKGSGQFLSKGGTMEYRLLADMVLVLHLCFVLFVLLGGLLVLRWRRSRGFICLRLHGERSSSSPAGRVP